MAAQELPNLILVDINLPDIDGLEVVKRLKEDAVLTNIPAVALTSNAMHGDRDRCLAAGFDAYLAKPVARIELKNTLEFFLKTNSTQVAV
jgi:CheY-like chemotaxis protein